jgi:hypothetical protein
LFLCFFAVAPDSHKATKKQRPQRHAILQNLDSLGGKKSNRQEAKIAKGSQFVPWHSWRPWRFIFGTG